MNMEEYIWALETYVASRKLNLGDCESVLSLLYEAYGDANRIDDGRIKADFSELYRLLNGMPLRKMDWIITLFASSAGIMSGMDLYMGSWWVSD